MLLALDTATHVISLALHDGEQVRVEASWETANHHTVELAPAVAEMLARAGIAPADLTGVAVALGPGSFTGLRIGLGLAKGLATALGLPLVGIPTLEILAASQPRFDGLLYTVLKAGRGRVCVQPFAWDAECWEPLGEPAIMGWADALAAVQAGQPALFSGEIDPEALQQIAAAQQEGAPITLAPAAHRLRRAAFLAERGWQRLRAGERDNPATLVPIYLHQPGVPHP